MWSAPIPEFMSRDSEGPRRQIDLHPVGRSQGRRAYGEQSVGDNRGPHGLTRPHRESAHVVQIGEQVAAQCGELADQGGALVQDEIPPLFGERGLRPPLQQLAPGRG